MLHIDADGEIWDDKIRLRIFPELHSKKKMTHVNGIIVHQTDSTTAESTFNQYRKAGSNGAHFLIDKDGTVYQTASLHRKTNHVGKLKHRCKLEKSCTPTEIKKLGIHKMKPTPLHEHEMKKKWPVRFPINEDSIGIELVGKAYPIDEPDPDKKTFESVTAEQNESLQWLVKELQMTLGLEMREVFTHPDISRKNRTEASTAKWFKE